MIGERFGMVVVIECLGVIDRNSRCKIKCDCGAEKIVRVSNVRHGNVKSCGCANYRNGKPLPGMKNKKKHPLYFIWANIISRCNYPGDLSYAWYGGRGIKVCDRWKDFEAFIADIGERPAPGMSLDRIDNDGNYEPSNIRWATRQEQMGNTRTNIRIDGMSLAQKCRETGINYETARRRYARGENFEEIVMDLIAKRGAVSPSFTNDAISALSAAPLNITDAGKEAS